jgi:hypothetical protein
MSVFQPQCFGQNDVFTEVGSEVLRPDKQNSSCTNDRLLPDNGGTGFMQVL